MLRIRDLTVGDVMTPAPRCLDESCSLAGAATFMASDRLHGAPVIDARGTLRGVVSQADLVQAFAGVLTSDREPSLEDLRRVRDTSVNDLLGDEGPVTCGEGMRLTEACKLLIRQRVHRLLVTREGGELVGLLSAIDVARALACLYEQPGDELYCQDIAERQPLVSTWMTAAVVVARPDESARAALERMESHDVRHLVVVEGEAIAGMVSNRDVVRVTNTNAGRVLDLDGATAADIMTPAPLRTVPYQATLLEAAEAMHTHKVNALPVMREGRLAGIITSEDLLAAMLVDRPVTTQR